MKAGSKESSEKIIEHLKKQIQSLQGKLEETEKSSIEYAEKTKILSDHATAGIYEIDFRTRRFLSVNDVVCDVLGYTREELLNMDAEAILDEGSKHDFIQSISRSMAGENAAPEGIYRIRKKNGETIWTELRVRPLHQNGKVTGALVIAYNINDRKLAEEALKISEEKFSKAFNHSPNAITITRLSDGLIIEGNDYVYDLLGYKRDEVVGKSTFELDIWVNRDDRSRLVSSIKSKGYIKNEEYKLQKKDQTKVIVDLSATLININNQLCMLASFIDVTARRNTEEALRKSEKSLAEAQHIAHIGSWEWNMETGEVWWSPELYNIYGLDPEKFTPTIRSFTEYIHPEDLNMVKGVIRECILKGDPVNIDFRIIRNGEVRFLLTMGELSKYDEDGRPHFMVGINQDITERKLAEEALRESETRFMGAVNAAEEGVWDWNLQTNEAWFSRRYKEMIGYNEDEIEHHIDSFFSLLHPLDKERTLSHINDVLEGKCKYEIEFRMLHKKGYYIPVLSLGLPVRKETNGKITRIIGTHLDLTRFKEAEKALKLSEERFRYALQNAPVSVAMQDLDLKYIWAYNQKTARPADIIGHTDDEIFTLAEARTFTEIKRSVISEKKSKKGDFWLERTSGNNYMSIYWDPVFDENGKTAGVVSATVDITSLKLAQEDLKKLNRILKALNSSRQKMVYSTDEMEYLHQVCDIFINQCGYRMIWIGYLENDEAGTVTPVCHAGFEEGYTAGLRIAIKDPIRGNGPTGVAIKTMKPAFCKNMQEDDSFLPWREEAKKRGINSSVVLPLISSGKAFGAINIYSEIPDPYSDDEVRLLQELAGDLSFGIMAIRSNLARTKAENELLNTKNYLENLISYANAPIIVWNYEKVIILFNKAFEHLTGYSESEVIGKKLDMLFPAERMRESMSRIEQAFTEHWETIEIPVLTKNGEIKIVLWNSANIYDQETGKLISTIAQGNDITERIRAEQEARKSTDKLNLALDNGGIGTWEMDLSTKMLTWDERMAVILGVGKNVQSMTWDSFETLLEEENVPHIKKSIENTICSGKQFDTIFRLKSSMGETRYIKTNAFIEKDNSNSPVKMVGVSYDISEMQKATEKTLIKVNEELLRSNKELEQFAYVASHDLQEPLRMVSSFTQLLSIKYGDKLDENAREYIRFAQDGSSRMYNLINDLLAFSRVQTRGKEFVKVDMNIVTSRVLHTLGIRIKETNSEITFAQLPVITADNNQVTQLMQNLISNSLKFCNTKPVIRISCSVSENCYTFSVSDNGIGIESQYYDRIFQVFKRLNPGDKYPGTGIGLAICKRIVENHGGRIWLESEPGKGSTFYFTIPK